MSFGMDWWSDMSGRSKLVFMNGPYAGRSIALSPGKAITIGRDHVIELSLKDEHLSRRHCVITSENNRFSIADLGSVNGTFVNGSRLTETTELQAFDRVFFGSTEMEFREDNSD